MEVEGVMYLIGFSLLTASLSAFIQKCLESGMILRRYYVFLNYLWIKWREKKRRRQVLKPIGLCIYCYSAWVYLVMYTLFNDPVLEVTLGLGTNYIFIEIWQIYLKKAS